MSTMNKILEYMALEKPIVQFDLLEGRRSAGEASLYATDNDFRDLARQMAELLDDPDRRARMGAEGRRRVEERLEWRHQVPGLLAAYERALTYRRGGLPSLLGRPRAARDPGSLGVQALRPPTRREHVLVDADEALHHLLDGEGVLDAPAAGLPHRPAFGLVVAQEDQLRRELPRRPTEG